MGLISLHLECKIQVGNLRENGKNSGHKKYPVSYKRQVPPPGLTVTSEADTKN